MTTNNADETISVASETMLGDLRSICMQEIRHGTAGEPWSKLPEAQQRAVVQRVEQATSAAIKKAVRIIAAGRQPSIGASVESVTVKDGMKCVLKAARTEQNVTKLSMAQGMPVQVIVADADPYLGESKPEKVDKDQPDLGDDDGWEKQ